MNYLPEYIVQSLEAEDLSASQTDDMIEARAATFDMVERMAMILGRIDHELQVRMEADRATAIDHPEYDISLKPSSAKYDPGKLQVIFEYVDPATVESSGAYAPEHQETVPASWNMTKAKTLTKFSGHVADIIAAARIEGRPKFEFKPKK